MDIVWKFQEFHSICLQASKSHMATNWIHEHEIFEFNSLFPFWWIVIITSKILEGGLFLLSSFGFGLLFVIIEFKDSLSVLKYMNMPLDSLL